MPARAHERYREAWWVQADAMSSPFRATAVDAAPDAGCNTGRRGEGGAAMFGPDQYLVETDWLAEHLDDPDVRVLEVTAMLTRSLVNGARAECYEPGHLPGSLFFDVASGHGELSAADAPLPWTWPPEQQFAETMGRYGIGNDTRVVLVARTARPGLDVGTMWCTRAWWTMHHMGVDVAVLRGGIEKWVEEGRPLTTAVPEVPPAAFTVRPGWERARADRHDVLAAVQAGAACVVDALPASSYEGSSPGYGPRKGHITNAVNVPFTDLVAGETARFLPVEQLADRLRTAGLLDAPRVITYCGGAIAATVDAFALALVGHPDVAVYDGSLMEWAADPDLPMTDPSAG
jgi:thiosulfate/3-mercaptopyruvate sulfurtransferase